MASEATRDLATTRASAMRVAALLVAKGQKSEAIEILTAWASASNDQEGHKLLAEALRHGPDNPLAKAAFARMEGLKTDQSMLDAARARWSGEELERVEKEAKKPPPGGWQAEVGYNNNVQYREQTFHIQTEDSGVKRPHIITHLFADGGRILKSYKRSYSGLIGEGELSPQVRAWMKGQHKEMYIALREGRFDNIIDGKEPGGMETFEGPPNPERRNRQVSMATAERPAPSAADVPVVRQPLASSSPSDLRPAAASSSDLRPAVAASPDLRPAATAPAGPAPTAPRPGPARPPPPPISLPGKGPPRPAAAPQVSPARARLHVIRALGDGPVVHELRDEATYIGRDGGVVVVGDRFASPKHARLSFRNGKLEVEDAGSENGTFLRIRYPVELEYGDVFIAGDQVLRVDANPPPNDGPDASPTYFYSSPKWSTTFRLVQVWEGGTPGMCVVARGAALQIGRSGSDLCFPQDFWLSDVHCLIEDQGGERQGVFLMLTDLNSRNGTFTRVKGPTRVSTGDEILVGRTRLRVEMLPPSKSALA